MYGCSDRHSIFFEKDDWKELDNCLNALRQFPKLRDLSLEKLMRLIEIKTAYEKQQYEHLADLLGSFHIFLNRNKNNIGAYNYALDKLFIQTLRQMLKYVSPKKKKTSRAADLSALYALLQQPGYKVAERSWLEAKCRELL